MLNPLESALPPGDMTCQFGGRPTMRRGRCAGSPETSGTVQGVVITEFLLLPGMPPNI